MTGRTTLGLDQPRKNDRSSGVHRPPERKRLVGSADDVLLFWQLNLQHGKTSTAVLTENLTRADNAVVLVQEPWVKDNKILELKIRNCSLYKGTTQQNPRACIISKGLRNVYSLPQFCGRDCTVVCIKYFSKEQLKEIVVASIYMPIDGCIISGYLDSLVQYGNDQNKPLIIGADTNAHHYLWGSEDCNHRGNELSEYLTSTILEVANVGNRPTFCSGNRSTVIDVTLVTRTLLQDIYNWHIASHDTMSDHRQITFSVRCDRPARLKCRNRKKTDWIKYDRELSSHIGMWIGQVRTPVDVERELNVINTTVIQAFEKACPERTVGGRKKVPWWNGELQNLRRQVNKAFHYAYKTRRIEDWEDYKKVRRVFKRVLRRSKRESWQSFCTRLEQTHESSRIHKILGKTQEDKLGMLQLPDGSWTKDETEVYQHLLETHFPGCVFTPESVGTTGGNTYRWIPSTNWQVAAQVITEERVRWAINSMAPYKSAGEDGVFPALLQKGINHLATPICALYRASLALRYTTKVWRIARVAFIPKPGKPNYITAKAFRPISLTSFLLKGLEKLVDRYLRDGPLASLPIHSRQHAYQPGRSTISALHQLVGRIEKALDAKQYALGVFFDIEGAFDNTSPMAVKESLRERDT